MAAGALAGVLASFFLRLPIRGVWKDALLGLLGFLEPHYEFPGVKADS